MRPDASWLRRALRAASFPVAAASLAACSSGTGHPATPQSASTAAAQAAEPSSPASTMPDPDRTVPDGTLTWKIVYTAHASASDIEGAEADIAKATTRAHWVVEGSAKLAGTTGSGELDRAGNETDEIPMASASAPDPMQQAVGKCNGDRSCEFAAMMKLANNPKATAGMEARGDAIEAFTTRLDAWADDDPDGGTRCRITADGSRSEDWDGGARFRGDSGIVTIPYSAHEHVTGSANFDCSGDDRPRIALRADPVTGVYDVLLPGLHVDAAHDTEFTTTGPKPNAVDRESTRIDLPPVALKGLPFPQPLRVLHGERTVHRVGDIPAAHRNVHLHGKTNATSSMYAVARDRPAIPLDADITWTFTPSHG